MSKVCVVTGGGSGMGLAAAKLMPKDHIIVVSGRTESKLTKAVEELTAAGFTAHAKSCDTSKRDSFQALADERNGCLAGVDILCDGGTIRGMHEFKKPQQS